RIQVCNKDNCFPVKTDELPIATLEVVEGPSNKVVAKDLADALDILEGRKSTGQANRLATPAGPTAVGPAGVAPAAPATSVHGRKAAKPTTEYEAELTALRSADNLVYADGTGPTTSPGGSLLGFLATAALWGLISLVTPCVFPMIPITVSIFLKQA